MGPKDRKKIPDLKGITVTFLEKNKMCFLELDENPSNSHLFVDTNTELIALKTQFNPCFLTMFLYAK